MGQTSKSISTPRRLEIVDAIKGIAIVLMVLGHVEQGAMHRQVWASMPTVARGVNFSNDFIYSFHMPVFFFVSGLFLAGSVERRGKWQFVLEKARTLLYPYLLWALLSFIWEPLTLKFRAADRLPTLHERVTGILTGSSSWFLITLFVTQLLVLLMLRLPRWLQMSTALAASFLIPESLVTVVSKPILFLPFVVAGMWFSRDSVERIMTFPKSIAWMSFAILLIVQLAVIRAWGPVNHWDRIPVGLMGIAMLLFLCHAISDTVSNRALCWYGEASLGIFILSPFFQGASREFVARALHTTNPFVYLTFITLCASTIPAVLWFSQDRLHIGWMFKFPAPKKAAPRSIEQQGQAVR